MGQLYVVGTGKAKWQNGSGFEIEIRSLSLSLTRADGLRITNRQYTIRTHMALSRFHYERLLLAQGHTQVAGVDEAGRGPLAGPVVAAAVIFPVDWIRTCLPRKLWGLDDSKRLTPEEREKFYAVLTTDPAVRYGVSIVDAGVIDTINILRATHRAMAAALDQLEPGPEHILVDGLPVHSLRFPQTALIQGDGKSYSIAAASVIAKVTRDRIMVDFDRHYPVYKFAEHKGYGTPDHLAALAEHGPCPLHRRSFAPLRPVAEQLRLFEA